jgi:hypothetical protein
MALLSRKHLLLRCKRPSLRSAGKEGRGYHLKIAVQTATRAAAKARADLIRQMLPYKESHTFALGIETLLPSKMRGMGVSFRKPHRMIFYGMLMRIHI